MLIRAVQSYLEIRRATGFQLYNTERRLRDFAHFSSNHADTHIRVVTASAWAARAASMEERDRRLKDVIRFARHVRAEDPMHEVPPDYLFAGTRARRLPYIFTPEQVSQILEEAGQLNPAGSLRPHTYKTLFGLLASCGLRISEALSLRLDDVTADGLLIHKAKFYKSRLVPMHETAERALRAYLHHRRRVAGATDRIFVSLLGRPLCYPTVNATFLAILRKLGFRAGPREPGPRLHDFRHTMAVRALEDCPRDQIPNHVVALSTYLGHGRIAHTYWYLHVTPQLMAGIAEACRVHLHGGTS